MKAIVYTEYGPPEVLQLKEVEKPIPKDSEVLIRIYATTVTSGDVNLRSLNVPTPLFRVLARINCGVRRPRNPRLGTEFAGEVESVGKYVSLFKKGDQVFGTTTIAGLGAYAEYKCLPEGGVLALKPTNMTYEEAAGVCHGGFTALHFLKKANIRSGQNVLINGASGGVGTSAVQLARYFGAEVTGVCSTANVELVKSLGADRVIDYTQEDFTQSGQTYDIIFDTVGKTSFSRCKGSLKEGGIYLATVFGLTEILQMLWTAQFGSRRIFVGVGSERVEDLNFLGELLEAGKIRIVIDRTYPLELIVEAHRYVDAGHKKGNVVITMEHDNKS
jgi:NADPH:quinone reductase-like Zn-dependent oxidoreductase